MTNCEFNVFKMICGAADYEKGMADVTLKVDGDKTVLKYEATAQIGGKIARLGNLLIQSRAKILAWKIFTLLAKVMERA